MLPLDDWNVFEKFYSQHLLFSYYVEFGLWMKNYVKNEQVKTIGFYFSFRINARFSKGKNKKNTDFKFCKFFLGCLQNNSTTILKYKTL